MKSFLWLILDLYGCFYHFQQQYKVLEKDTETNLKKFKTVGQNLAPQLSETKRPLLEKEVVEVEKKVLMVMSTLKENLEYLERSTEKWTNFNFKLEGFISQIDGIIDKLKSILSEEASPEERLRKLDVSIKKFQIVC